jgi:hypothetical protein
MSGAMIFHETSEAWGTEIVLVQGNAMQLRADGEDPAGTSYVRVCDPAGAEVMYWNEDEWREEPAQVMGAIIGCLAVVEKGDPDR